MSPVLPGQLTTSHKYGRLTMGNSASYSGSSQSSVGLKSTKYTHVIWKRRPEYLADSGGDSSLAKEKPPKLPFSRALCTSYDNTRPDVSWDLPNKRADSKLEQTMTIGHQPKAMDVDTSIASSHIAVGNG